MAFIRETNVCRCITKIDVEYEYTMGWLDLIYCLDWFVLKFLQITKLSSPLLTQSSVASC